LADCALLSGLGPRRREAPGSNHELDDDEPGLTAAVQRALEAYGYRVMHSADGTEAIAQFAQHLDEVSLMLTDLMMPFMDGIALIRAVRRIKPELPVIAMSGLGDGARFAELKTLGVQTLVNKPFHAPILLDADHQALQPAGRG
jgi:CheY-like chemotaxis protein